MTRCGKIARLPKEIREELNRRLDDGEPGVQLVEWLNGLAEVKKIVETDFEGEPISESNLTRWKNGGFVDWVARVKAEAMMEGWGVECRMRSAECGMGGGAASGPGSGDGMANGKLQMAEEGAARLRQGCDAAGGMVEGLTNALVVHYAAAVQDSNANSEEEPAKRVERLGKSLKDMSRLRRHELARERLREHVRIGGEWVALERERLEIERAKLSRETRGGKPGPDEKERERLRHLEKAEMVKKMLREA
jgi:hypothetical protein